MILLIDNNDSFTYNVVSVLNRVTDMVVDVRCGDSIALDDVSGYSHVIFSPGPGLPGDFPIMAGVLERYDGCKSILGVCLGHQAVCEHYGGCLRNLSEVAHGVETEISCLGGSRLFGDVGSMVVGRYHSWVVEQVPSELVVTARDSQGLIMAVEHSSKRVFGVQFHPESFITRGGEIIFKNFLYGNL